MLQRKRMQMFALMILTVALGLCSTESYADSLIPFYQNTKTIVVAAKAGGTPNTESSKRGYQIILDTPELKAENIQNIAASYFRKNLKKEIPIITPKNNFDYPMSQETIIYKFHYSAREIEIDGKKQKIGAISLNLWRPSNDENKPFYTEYQWEPVEAFLIDGNSKKLQKNLENIIAGMLERRIIDLNKNQTQK